MVQNFPKVINSLVRGGATNIRVREITFSSARTSPRDFVTISVTYSILRLLPGPCGANFYLHSCSAATENRARIEAPFDDVVFFKACAVPTRFS